VSSTDFNAAWIEQLENERITDGCEGEVWYLDYYCPNLIVTKEQLAIMLFNTKFGSFHYAPSATGLVFDDVGANDFAAKWIEDLYNEGIITGCDANNYCPNEVITQDGLTNILNNAFQ